MKTSGKEAAAIHAARQQCKQEVHDRQSSWPRFHQCRRKAVKDGYCKQHHPDTVAERERKSKERWDKKWANSPTVRLRKAEEEIKGLKAQLDAVKGLPKYDWAEVARYGARHDTDWMRARDVLKALGGNGGL